MFRIRRRSTKELGGYIEAEKNLSQDGNAWIKKLNHCINVINIGHSITATPQYIQIGCQNKTFAQWMKVTKKQAVQMGLHSISYLALKSLLKIIHKEVMK